MPASVKAHYDNHLAPLYSWIYGGAEPARARFAGLLNELNLRPSQPGAAALDLGAGNGFQSLPLATVGYAVTAVDLSDVLLAELDRDAAAAGLCVHTLADDLRTVARNAPSPAPEVIVCMGDTLPHLPSLDDVAQVIRDAARALAPGGHLLLSFRDYSAIRVGADRFIPVRSEPDRIFTCFLEFGPEKIAVHDIVHTRDAGEWRMTVSAYEKLRLPPAFVREQLALAGLETVRDTVQNGLVTLVSRRLSLS